MKFLATLFTAAVALTSGAYATNLTAPTSGVVQFGVSSATPATGLDNGVYNLIFNVATPHSSFSVTNIYGDTTSVAFKYAYSNNLTTTVATTAPVAVAAASPVTNQYQVSQLTTSVCNANVTVGSNYNFIPHPVIFPAAGATSTVLNVDVLMNGYSDANIQLQNSTAGQLALAAVDSTKLQPGKFFYFNIPANATAGAGNNVNATIQLAGATNPFSYLSVVGGAKCPIINATDGVTRYVTNLTSLTALAGSAANNLTGIVTGSNVWVYLAPSATLAAGTSTNQLQSTDYITLTYGATGLTNCTAGTNGFCSGAASLKSVVGVAFAGVMAAAVLLL